MARPPRNTPFDFGFASAQDERVGEHFILVRGRAKALTMTAQPLYTRDILRLATAIPHLAPFEEVAAEPLRSPTCGSRVAALATLDADGRVVAYSQAVEACAFGQAAAALVGRSAAGTDLAAARAALAEVEAWLAGAQGEPWPGLAALEPARARTARHGAILLPFRALVAAIEKAR